MRRRFRLAAVAAAVGLALVLGDAAVAPVQTADAASSTLPGWLHTDGSSIKTASGSTYRIKAVAWFGMETATCAPHGLWTISLAQGLATIRSMGFNTIRLPFSNECLHRSATSSIDAAKNPSLVGASPQKVMDAIVSRSKAYGLNVILDRHRPDSGAQSPLWYTDRYSEADWIRDWKRLAKRYRTSSNVIGFDLHNEPHGSACWGCGDRATDWRAAAQRAGNAVLKVNSRVLIIVEGVENQSSGNTWWGGGLAGVASKPVTLKVKHRVVYSPHDYPASIYRQQWFTASSYPKNLTSVWDANWGYIDKRGIAPILLGEFGSKLETTSDRQWLTTMVKYLKKNKMSFAYWSFNPNSGDTGGLVKDDWTTRQKAKLRYLEPPIGDGSTVRPLDEPTSPTPAPSPVPKPRPAPQTPVAKGAAKAGFAVQSAWQDGYVASVTVTAGKRVSSWTVTWPSSRATGIASAWGMTCSVKRHVSVTCTGADWARSIPAGGSVSVGLQVTATAAPAAPRLALTARY